MKAEEIKKAVRDRYAKFAASESSCCAPAEVCCSPVDLESLPESISKRIGYSEKELGSVPSGANLGLGCGNPTALASLEKGERVLDLGSGAGFDAFLAARAVGSEGWVIGVDMTPEMIAKAQENARKGDYGNVEFRLGEIERLPVDDCSIDVVISNCVINLAPDKGEVFTEAFRVLKPGGRLMVSDLVLLKELPGFIKSSVQALTGCIAGALRKDHYLEVIRQAGFAKVEVVSEASYPISEEDSLTGQISEQLKIPRTMIAKVAGSFVSSIQVLATKPE